MPSHQRDQPSGVTGAGENLRESCVLRGAGVPLTFISNYGVAGGAADVAPARWTRPGVNLRRALRAGFRNVLILSEDHRLPHLSDELSKLRVGMVGVLRQGSLVVVKPVARVLFTMSRG